MSLITQTPSRSSLVKSDYSNDVFALTIWSNILHWRKYRGMSQQQLSKKTWLTQAAISEIENGDGNPTIETLSKISKALDIAMDMMTRNRIMWKMIEAIDYMTKKIHDIDILKAMKLLYFADLESLQHQGQKVIWLQYIRWNRWPFNQDIYQLNDIFPKESEKYCSWNFASYISLSVADQSFLDTIINHYGQYTATKLMDLSYNTPPMKWYSKGDNKGMGAVVL